MKYEIMLSNIWMCLVVMFIHIISYSVPSLSVQNNFDIMLLLLWTLSLFVVPGFIFFSGMKSFLKKDLNYPKFLLKRIFTILIPYLIWSYIYFIYFRSSDFFSYKNLPPSELFFGITLGSITSHLYFVIIIMQFYLLMPLWKLIIDKASPYIVLPAALMIMLISKQFLLWITATQYTEYFNYVDRIFIVYSAFWICGCYAGRYYDSFRRIISKNGIPICIIFAVSSFLIMTVNFQKYFMMKDLPFIDNMFTLYQFSAVIFLYFISLKLSSEKIGKSFILNMINSESYNIYLSHCLLIVILQRFLADDTGCSTYMQLFIRFSITYSVILLFWMIYYCIKLLLKKLIHIGSTKKRKGKH